jgi:hypothetical protein
MRDQQEDILAVFASFVSDSRPNPRLTAEEIAGYYGFTPDRELRTLLSGMVSDGTLVFHGPAYDGSETMYSRPVTNPLAAAFLAGGFRHKA